MSEKRLRIKDLREDNDLTQKQVADFLKFDRAEYSKIENERRPLPMWIAEKLADYYGTSVDFLLGRTEIKEAYPRKV